VDLDDVDLVSGYQAAQGRLVAPDPRHEACLESGIRTGAKPAQGDKSDLDAALPQALSGCGRVIGKHGGDVDAEPSERCMQLQQLVVGPAEDGRVNDREDAHRDPELA
jgi:hypothetical protein